MAETTPSQSDLPATPVASLIEASAARFPDRPAMEFLGRRWNYTELGALVDRAARGFQDLGLAKGDRIGLCLPNTPYFVALYYAALKAGLVVVTYNPLYVERELRQQITDSGTRLMAVPDLEVIYRKVANVAADGVLDHVVVCPMAGILPRSKAALFTLLKRREHARLAPGLHHISFAQLTANRRPPEPVPISPLTDLAVLQYTGGTTGTPKSAMLTHANLTTNCRQLALHHATLRPGVESVLAVLPLFHIYAMSAVMNSGVEFGAEIILLPRFEIGQVLRCIERQKPTILHAVPTIYNAINAAAGQSKRDLGSIRVCTSGGAPLPAEVRERFAALTGNRLLEGYGLTESPVVSCNPPYGLIKPGTVGPPLAGTQVEIRDPADPQRLLPPGEKGEVCIRGPQVMAGYWQRPAETEAAFIDGALRTGDIGVMDEDGYLSIVDRIKDLIICSGYNVYPRMLEEALYEHPAVAEAVVIGVPDAYRGQAPKAFVTLRQGTSATATELRAFLSERVSKIELPQTVVIRDSLPKTMVGKLSKKQLLQDEAQRRGDSA